MEDNFNIHLVSNVSQDIYPDNSPSKFVTLLSNEVSLKDQGWEVGVHDIMYPSRMNEKKDDDYIDIYDILKKEPRKLFPHHDVVPNKPLQPWTVDVGKELLTTFPAIIGKEIEEDKELDIDTNQQKVFLRTPDYVPKTAAEYDLFYKYYKKTNSKLYLPKIHTIAEKLVASLNGLECVKKGLIKFDYDRKRRKCVLYVYKADILVVLTRDLAELLGFVFIQYFYTGTIGSEYSFENTFYRKVNVDSQIYIVDILNMKREEIEMKSASDDFLEYEVPYSVDTSTLNEEAMESLPKDLKFTLKFDFLQQRVMMNSEAYLQKEHLQNYKTFAIFSLTLDDETLATYKFPKYFTFELNFNNYKKSYEGKFQGISNHMQFNKQYAKKFLPNQIKDLMALKPKLILRKMYAEGIEITKKYDKRFNMNLDEDISDLNSYITKVNENKVATFSFDQAKRRFQVQTSDSKVISLSPSLSWKLGFTNTCAQNGCPLLTNGAVATHFPILHREIHELYIYTNIIESAYVGDVKAPLLLVCPFNKNTNALTHLQFENPTYKALNRNSFQQIEIAIFNAFGEPVDFSYGRTVVNLHFRKTSL